MEELHIFALNEGHNIEAPSPLFSALEYSRPACPNADTAGYNMVAPGMRYFKIELVLNDLAYHRVELRRVRTVVGAKVTYKFEQFGDAVTIDIMKLWEMPPEKEGEPGVYTPRL